MPADVQQDRDAWVSKVADLVDQLAGWAAAEGWAVDRRTETITERRIGTYDAAALTIHRPDGQLIVTPAALDLIGRTGGRVDLEGMPSFNRVMLLGRPQGQWVIMTDSGVPIRLPWTRETFAQLAADLLA